MAATELMILQVGCDTAIVPESGGCVLVLWLGSFKVRRVEDLNHAT